MAEMRLNENEIREAVKCYLREEYDLIANADGVFSSGEQDLSEVSITLEVYRATDEDDEEES